MTLWCMTRGHLGQIRHISAAYLFMHHDRLWSSWMMQTPTKSGKPTLCPHSIFSFYEHLQNTNVIFIYYTSWNGMITFPRLCTACHSATLQLPATTTSHYSPLPWPLDSLPYAVNLDCLLGPAIGTIDGIWCRRFIMNCNTEKMDRCKDRNRVLHLCIE